MKKFLLLLMLTGTIAASENKKPTCIQTAQTTFEDFAKKKIASGFLPLAEIERLKKWAAAERELLRILQPKSDQK